jgi:hypothetical protein
MKHFLFLLLFGSGYYVNGQCIIGSSFYDRNKEICDEVLSRKAMIDSGRGLINYTTGYVMQKVADSFSLVLTAIQTSIPTNNNQLTNGSGFISSFTETDPLFNTKFAAKTTDGLAEGSANIYFSNARARSAISLTTTGSGAATYSSGVLNIPTYTPSYSLDTINTTSRNFNQAYQVSATKYVDITISSSIVCTLSLSGGQSGNIQLQVSPNGTTGWKTWGTLVSSNTGTLTIGLNTSQSSGSPLFAPLAPGEYWRLATTNTTGTPTFSFLGGGTKTYN